MPELERLEDHALKKMIESRMSVTLCTDNRLISDTTVCDEIELAIQHFDVPAAQLKQFLVYGFKRSFFPGSYRDKRAYVRRVISYYEDVAARFGVSA